MSSVVLVLFHKKLLTEFTVHYWRVDPSLRNPFSVGLIKFSFGRSVWLCRTRKEWILWWLKNLYGWRIYYSYCSVVCSSIDYSINLYWQLRFWTCSNSLHCISTTCFPPSPFDTHPDEDHHYTKSWLFGHRVIRQFPRRWKIRISSLPFIDCVYEVRIRRLCTINTLLWFGPLGRINCLSRESVIVS